MAFFLGYMLFAFTTALASIYELVWPVLKAAEAEGIEINKPLYVLIFIGVNTLAAPIVFLSCVVPSYSLRFQFALKDALFSKD